MTQAKDKLDNAKRSAERALDESRQAAEQALGAGRAKIEETGKKLTERAGERLGEIREKARKGYEKATGMVENGYGNARESLKTFTDDVGTCIRDHPAAALSVAAAAGLAFGLALGRPSEAGATD